MRARHLFRLVSTLLFTIGLFACTEPTGSAKKSGADKKSRPATKHLVVTETLTPRAAGLKHELTGTLRARQKVRIFSQEEGRITELPFYEGDRIKEGQLLARLESDLLEAELQKAAATTRQSRLNLKRIEDLARYKATSEDELARARTEVEVSVAEQKILETRLAYTQIKAPFSGVISQRLVEPGDVVPRHTHLLTLIDPESLIIEIPVSDLLLPNLSLGDPVLVSIDGLGSQQFTGKVKRIHPELDINTRMGIIEVVLDPTPQAARPGQLSRVNLETAQKQRLMVPFKALQRDNAGEYVFLLDGNSKALRTTVTSGSHIANWVEIVTGLKVGDIIISKGILGLRNGKRVTPVE
ncbi:efflux RND transporter periplasmic adaptor subunit [endosymbiont of Lamellibrachia barhami]|uniref:efflux RND transporter periplasmic adaptor subunit n=1 Tax=endosymbiont of Lamellibrachia barhami TaxID=205975 RepID=UPI0015B2B997|nr:efflux RND transporter periplasmic adaptor subunit [endosymbiont of Lamellibrachia barhami]